MTLTLIAIFIIGYLAIALEHTIRIDKSATALMLGMLLWVIYAAFSETLIPLLHPGEFAAYVERSGLGDSTLREQTMSFLLNKQIVFHLGDIAQTLIFLIGAMTIVEIIDVHEGFSVITKKITTRRKRLLLVVICVVTFFLSAILDNLTTTIVMLMLLRKLVADAKDRWLYAGMVIIAANTGGAWSPIGDVTTIMLWVKGNVTTSALISYVLLPSIVALVVPMVIVAFRLKGEVTPPKATEETKSLTTPRERQVILILGVAGLIFVPIFKAITHLPPFVGVLFSLSILWMFTECFYNRAKFKKLKQHRVSSVVKRIDMSTILFFLGILMAVAVLEITGILETGATWLDANLHDVFAINFILGILSSVVDNVPLVAAAMGMYPIEAAGATGYAANFMVDGTFWEFLSYCAGVGGSILIIGSAAGVIAMGIEKIRFGWYCKNFSLLAFAGYLAGAFVYWAECLLK